MTATPFVETKGNALFDLFRQHVREQLLEHIRPDVDRIVAGIMEKAISEMRLELSFQHEMDSMRDLLIINRLKAKE